MRAQPSNHRREGITTMAKSIHDTPINFKHGKSFSPEHNAWRAMKGRCYNKNNQRYEYYGGRGIIVCDRWINSFENFYEDMGPRPSKNHSIDRKNNNGNYEPSNCHWATAIKQLRNRNSVKIIQYNGESKCVSEWAEMLNIPRRTLHNRLFRLHWSIERALTTSRIR